MRYNGLTPTQVETARASGENKLASRRKNSVAGLFFSQFKDLMILILAAATVVSAMMGEGIEAITIIAIVLLNAVMGFLQEYKTEKTLSALQAMTAPVAHVIRDAVQSTIPADQVVCGDIILLRAGDRVPADGVLLEATDFAVDEALLTGESTVVDKQHNAKAYMGTMVASGSAVMRVEQVGMATEMGKVARLIEDAEPEKTPLQNRLQQLGKVVAISCLVVCVGVAMIGWLRGEPFLEMLLSGISLAVAAIPEGLPAIVTIVLALSVGRILKKGAIIRRLPAVETLGCAGVICSDKTGTITQNRMTVCDIACGTSVWQLQWTGAGEKYTLMQNGKSARPENSASLQRLLRCAALCADARVRTENGELKAEGNPTEIALLTAALRLGVTAEQMEKKYKRIAQIPFDSARKRMSVTVQTPEGQCLLCKGAPDILLNLCSKITKENGDFALTAVEKRQITAQLHKFASQGCRVIAFAEGTDVRAGEKNLVFLGMAALEDPPKPQVETAVRRCRRAGMKPVMITGDYPETARAVAERVGIFKPGDRIVTGSELDGYSDERLAQICMDTSVYARVTPQHKLRIVKAYQNCRQVVAMTGDAVML